MNWQIAPIIDEILKKGGGFAGIDRADAIELMHWTCTHGRFMR